MPPPVGDVLPDDRKAPPMDDFSSRTRDLRQLSRDLRPPAREVPDYDDDLLAPELELPLPDLDPDARPPMGEVPTRILRTLGSDAGRPAGEAQAEDSEAPPPANEVPTRILRTLGPDAGRPASETPAEDDEAPPPAGEVPTRILRTLGPDAGRSAGGAPAEDADASPPAGEASPPTRDLRMPERDVAPPERDVDPLPPLPVRPPRIPALRPDPRLAPPPADRPVAAGAPERDTAPPPAASALPAPPVTPPVPPTAPEPPAPPAPAQVEPTWPERPSEPAPTTVLPTVEPPAAAAAPVAEPPAEGTVPLPHVGERPPTYDPEPTALPAADPDLLGALVSDTVIDGARYGTMTLRAASVRGDSARYRGENRGDRLLTARFGEGADALLAVVIATPAATDDPSVADDACRQLAAAIGRSRPQLLGDLRTGAQENLRYGLQRLTARATVRLRGAESEVGSTGALHALIAPLDPTSRLRAGFGVGPGALLLLGDDAWYDAYAGRRLVRQQPSAEAQSEDGRFRFRVVVPEPGDVLLLCSEGLAQPLREEPAVSDFLADHWAHPHPPGMADYLRHVQVRAKGYAADRTAVALWED